MPPLALVRLNFDALLQHTEYWACRLGGFVVLNLLYDPAWLALIFC